MDILTQALLGSTLATTVADKRNTGKAAIIGACSGMLADADVLIRSNNDPLLVLEYHRHFSHSLFFIPAGALIASLLLYFFFKDSINKKQLFLYSLAGYSMSALLDACTSYGTSLFWPISEERIAWHIISIVDPVFSLLLVISLFLALRLNKPLYCKLGLLFAASYLLTASMQLNRAEQQLTQLIKARSHMAEQILVKPTFANILLWRSLYLHNGHYYIDAIRVGLTPQVYTGTTIQQLPKQEALTGLRHDSIEYADIERFYDFSKDYVVRHPTQTDVLGDIRFSILPTANTPLWGIRLHGQQQHVSYEVFRDASAEQRRLFFAMLTGKSLP